MGRINQSVISLGYVRKDRKLPVRVKSHFVMRWLFFYLILLASSAPKCTADINKWEGFKIEYVIIFNILVQAYTCLPWGRCHVVTEGVNCGAEYVILPPLALQPPPPGEARSICCAITSSQGGRKLIE